MAIKPLKHPMFRGFFHKRGLWHPRIDNGGVNVLTRADFVKRYAFAGLESINPDAFTGANATKALKAAIFDFDGTLSLIRQGWQEVMIPYFTEEMTQHTDLSHDDAYNRVRDFVDFLTGKQTIYQCIRLKEEIEQLGGTPSNPALYKQEYNERLLVRIKERLNGLASKQLNPLDYLVPGSLQLLESLKQDGLSLYLASGTDDEYVQNEARLLGVTVFFDGVYGANETFSKAAVIQQMLVTHNISGDGLLGFGDGFVEIENVKSTGGLAIGIASDEVSMLKDVANGISITSSRYQPDEWKRNRLISAGADGIIPDYII